MIVDDFADHLAQGALGPRTRRAYVDHLTLFARWFDATNGQPLSKTNLTNIDAREYRQYLVTSGAQPATVNTKLAAIKAFAAWCEIPLNVIGVAQQPLAPRWLDRREQAALLREAERAVNAATTERTKVLCQRTQAIIQLLLNTGLRVGELIALVPGDVTVSERAGQLIVRDGKGRKRREVALNKEARAALAVLTLPIGMRVRAVQKAIAKLARKAGVKCSPHQLRHSLAKNLSGKADEATIGALLGHSNPRTTRRYTTPDGRDLQKAVETLE